MIIEKLMYFGKTETQKTMKNQGSSMNVLYRYEIELLFHIKFKIVIQNNRELLDTMIVETDFLKT